MSRPDYSPNEQIIDRAVLIWQRALAWPKYDHGDSSRSGLFTSVLMALSPKNNTQEVLDAFGAELKSLLMTKQPYDHKPELSRFITSIGVDYDPDSLLSSAAAAAGLKMQFPCKTNMHLYVDCISFSNGYGAENIYHYPLKDGKWLTTTLSGSDIDKVIEYAEGGTPTFQIEDCNQ